MMDANKWLLTGAWTAMAAVGAFSIYKGSEAPKVDPAVEMLCRDLRKIQEGPLGNPPGPVPRWNGKDVFGPVVDARPVAPGVLYIAPKIIEVGVPHPIVPTKVLPFLTLGKASAGLDGTTLTWSTEDKTIPLEKWRKQEPAKPTGFSVYRQEAGRPREKIAELDPTIRSYTDSSIEPLKTYFYSVTLQGMETDRTTDPGSLVPTTKEADRALNIRTPSFTRIKLVGGDKTHAVIRVETYNRTKNVWISKTVLAVPGERVAGTGWSLNALRFNEFTLVADVTDDDGAARVLSTRD